MVWSVGSGTIDSTRETGETVVPGCVLDGWFRFAMSLNGCLALSSGWISVSLVFWVIRPDLVGWSGYTTDLCMG